MRSEILDSVSTLQRTGLFLLVTLFYYFLLGIPIPASFTGAPWTLTDLFILFHLLLAAAYVFLLLKGIDWLLASFKKKPVKKDADGWPYLTELVWLSLFSALLLSLLLVIPAWLLSQALSRPQLAVSSTPWKQHLGLLYIINFVLVNLFYLFKAEGNRLRQFYCCELAREKLEKDGYKAQLDQLHSQVSPHFLFNNLNTLAALIRKDPALATHFLTQLSDLLRCALEYRSKDLITLRAEMKWVDAYAYLLKTRFRENVQFNIELDEKAYAHFLPPLTLQILIEGTIRRNVISSEQPLTIHIYADENQRLVFSHGVQERSDVPEGNSREKEVATLHQRFQFFTAKRLEVKQTEAEFMISLPLLPTDNPTFNESPDV